MKEQLVSFEVAKLAKDVGFNLKTHYCYLDEYNFKPFIEKVKCMSAPTQSLIQKWLRETYSIYISIKTHLNLDGKYLFSFNYYLNNKIVKNNKRFKTYEEALENGLIECLKHLKKNL